MDYYIRVFLEDYKYLMPHPECKRVCVDPNLYGVLYLFIRILSMAFLITILPFSDFKLSATKGSFANCKDSNQFDGGTSAASRKTQHS